MLIRRHPDQLDLPLDWGREPWHGVSPRALAQANVAAKLLSFEATCGVDKSEVGCPSREAQRIGPDPAQFTLFLKGKS